MRLAAEFETDIKDAQYLFELFGHELKISGWDLNGN